jgi:hypothetical protein
MGVASAFPDAQLEEGAGFLKETLYRTSTRPWICMVRKTDK